MTEKLYYIDAYIREFSAVVTECTEKDGYYLVALDKTAFFPSEAGQSADRGDIDGIEVLDAIERDDIVYHKTASLIEVGKTVFCRLDFEQRLEKMRAHTAEHLLSGIIYKNYGFSNVGFHLGESIVTFDASGRLDADMIERIEYEANRAVLENKRVYAYFPSDEELALSEYRSKSEILGRVRLVCIEDYDLCACCAPHVSSTGEIGLIKIVGFEPHRGGTRMYMLAGLGALADYKAKERVIRSASAMLSSPEEKIPQSLRAELDAKEALKYELHTLSLSLARYIAEGLEHTDGSRVVYAPELDGEAQRELANLGCDKTDGYFVALSGGENSYRYVISKKTDFTREETAELNSALSGRGGGRGKMISGSFYTSLEKIKDYFK